MYQINIQSHEFFIQVSFKRILISLTGFVDMLKSMKILHSTFSPDGAYYFPSNIG